MPAFLFRPSRTGMGVPVTHFCNLVPADLGVWMGCFSVLTEVVRSLRQPSTSSHTHDVHCHAKQAWQQQDFCKCVCGILLRDKPLSPRQASDKPD